VAVASVLAVAGILIHRVNIVLNGLSYATVPFPPGVPIGVAQPAGQTSFALTYFYSPTLIEYLVAGGIVCFGGLVFTLLAWKLPLREHGHGEPEGAAATGMPVETARG
jgi:Ni/Fe-hydrogenase subunit HybB-like protein